MSRTSDFAGIAVDRVTNDDGSTTTSCYYVPYGTPAWEAMLAWCRFHGLDPCSIPAGSRVVRDPLHHVIAYTVLVRGPRCRRPDRPRRTRHRAGRGPYRAW